MNNDEKKKLESVITSITESLVSHLYFCYHKSREGKRFHLSCVKQYQSDLNNSLDVFLGKKK